MPLQTKFADKRQMIRCHKRQSTAMQREAFHLKRVIEVNMIEVQKRNHSGIRLRAAQMKPYVGAAKMRRQHPRHESASPFVEISEHYPRAVKLPAQEYFRSDQPPRLMSAFEEGRAEMHIEDVKPVIVYFDIGAKATARLASAHAQVIVESPLHGEASEQDVSVRTAVEFSGLARKKIHIELLGYESRLILLTRSAVEADDFLKRDDIGVKFAQNFDYTGGAYFSVETFALVNVISSYPNTLHLYLLLPFKNTV